MTIENTFASFPVLETPRLVLRGIRETDAPEIFSIFSDEEVLLYYDSDCMKEHSEALDLINFLLKGYADKKSIRWAITLKGTDTVIGTCGFHNLTNRSKRAEIGYELSSEYWRKGLMTEALKAIITYGFTEMGFHRIEGLTEPDNYASRQSLLKLGFREEGLMLERDYYSGKYQDEVMHGLLSRDWKVQ